MQQGFEKQYPQDKITAGDISQERSTKPEGLAYELFRNEGFNGSFDDFSLLMETDDDARKVAYELFQEEGYEGSLEQFEELTQLKKKSILEKSSIKTHAEIALEYGSHPGLLERSEFDDDEGGLNPLISAVGYLGDQVGYTSLFEAGITTGSIQSELSQQIFPLLTSKDKFTEEQIERLISLNEELENAPQTKSRKKFDKNYYEALSEVNKKIADNPYGDLDLIESNFEQGKFSQAQKIAYEDYRKTGVLNKELLPKREVTFLDDLGAFFEATSKGGMPTAMSEIAISSLVSMFTNPAAVSAGAATGGAAALAAAPTVVGTGIAGAAGFFAGASALLDTTLRFNEYLNETLAEQGLEPNKENYKKILEDDELIQKLQIKALKGGLTVGAIDGVTTLLGASVAAKTASKGMQVAGRFKRATTVGAGGAAGTLIDASGGALGEAAAQAVTGEKRNTRAIIDEFFAEVPSAFATSSFAVGSEVRKSYKIKGKEVTKETFTNTLEALNDSDLANTDLSTNDRDLKKDISNRKKRQGIKENLDPAIPSDKVERIVDKELEIQKLDGKKSHTAKKKISQLKKEIDAIQEETVEDIEMSDLEQTLRDQGVQFQLSAEATPEEKKAELLDIAVQQIKEAQTADISEDVYKANQVDVERTKIDYSSQPLAEGVPQVSADTLVDKLINLVMADQLMVGEIKTSSGKVLQRKGGMFFSLIPELKDKIAWASIDMTAARNIVRGAIKSDETVVFNMNPSAIDSNVALVEYAFQEIQGKAKDQKAIFSSFKNYLSGLKLSDQAKDFLSNTNTFKELVDNFAALNTKDRATIAQNALPTETVQTKIPYYKELIDIGITIESSRDANIEPAIKGAPMGAMLSIIEVTDENGNRITDEADIDKAIVSREQAIKEGLPIHENYPLYIRGKHKALINDTAPFWNYMPEALDKIDLKIAGVIRTATKRDKDGKVLEDRPTTSREARGSAQRAGTMSSATAQRVSAPDVTQYEKFVNMVSKSFPSINVVTNETDFNQFRDDIYARQMITKNQKVYGAVRGNTLYINPDLQNFNTPIHEFGHIWINTVKEKAVETYNTGISLIKDSIYEKRIRESAQYTKVVKEMKKNGFSDAEVDSYILEEALATAIGDKGEAYVKASTLQKFRQWLQNLYDFIKTKLGISQYSAEEIENLTLDEFTEAVAVDILKGEPLFEESQVKTIDELQLQLEDSSIYEIIRVARNNGFPDSVIENFLQKKGFKKKEIAEAKKINVNALQELPASFYNAGTTALDGLGLFEKAFEYAKKRVKKYGSKKAIELTTDNLIKKSPIFKKSNDIVKEEMIRDFGRFMGKKFKSAPSPERVLMGIGRAVVLPKERATLMSEDMKKYRMMLRDLDRGAKNLLSLQREIRNFVRKYIPKAQYKKSEVNKLIKIITDAKTDTDVASAIREVEDIILTMHNKELLSKVDKLRLLKTTSKQSGKSIGRSVSVEVSDRLSDINKNIDTKTEEDIVVALKQETTANDINDLLIAGDYLSALTQDNASFGKMLSLSELESDLKQLINEGKNQRAQKRLLVKEQQLNNKITALKEIYGTDINIDDIQNINVTAQQKRKNQKLFDRAIKGFLKKIDVTKGLIFSDMTDVMDLLSRTSGDMIGGKLEEIVTMRFKSSENTYKAGKMAVIDGMVIPKLVEIFGKDYKKKVRNHGNVKFTGIFLENGMELELSQSQAYYIYNQSKDLSNAKSFENKYGENYSEILDKIKDYIDPEVKKWADYQTDILFPMLYDRYNETYREMYDTNLPWNNNYAGRIFREGMTKEDIDLMKKPLSHRSSVAGPSTKERVKTTSPIKDFDGNVALNSYLLDMEQFRAYATSVRDIDALFRDPDVENAIDQTSGPQISNIVKEMIKVISERGQSRSAQASLLNSGVDLFIASRLGFNPIIALKQLTSIFAYTSDIGLVNWSKYSPKAMANFTTIWKEITDNSIYIKDRYNKSTQDALTAAKSVEAENFVSDKYRSGINDYVQFSLKLIMYGDKGGITGGIPNYLYYKEQYKTKNPKATNQEIIDNAIKKFEYDTSKAQQSYDLTDRDLLQSNPYARVFNVFLTTPKQYMRKEVQALRQIRRQFTGQNYKRTFGKNIYQFLLYHVGLPVLFQAVTLGLPFRKAEEDDYEDLIRAALLGNINSFIILGDLAVSIADYAQNKPWAGRFRSLALLEAISVPQKSWSRWIKNKNKSKERELLTKAIFESLAITGAPLTLYKYVDLVADVIERKVSPQELFMRMIGYSEYQARKGE